MIIATRGAAQVTSFFAPYACDACGREESLLIDTVAHRDRLLRADVRAAWDLGSADYALVHHEDHFNEVDHQIWASWGRPAPVYVLTYDGVPIVSVYRNPHR